MHINDEILRRRLRQVRRDLSFWTSRVHLYRNSPYKHGADKRRTEKRVSALTHEELDLMDQLGELREEVTYLPPSVTSREETTGHWKANKRKFKIGRKR